MSWTAERNALDRKKPPATRPNAVQSTAAASSRAARESRLSAILAVRFRNFEAIAKATHRLNEIGVQFLAQATDEPLDRIRVAVEILIVKMLDQFGARDDLAAMMREIGKQPVLERRELHRIS